MHIKDWEVFQHYKNRKPPWIRLYRDLLDDPEFFSLNGEQVKILVLLWLIASEDPEMKGILPSLDKLSFRLRARKAELSNVINGLSHWVVFKPVELQFVDMQNASSVLAPCLQHARPETETEGETDQREIRGRDTVTAPPETGAVPTDISTHKKKKATRKLAKQLESTGIKPTKPVNGTATWQAYSQAYEIRYGTAPVRNAKTNSLCKQLLQRLGSDEAPKVAQYYPTTRTAYYVARGHSLECLVKDAEKIRTEWVTGHQITQTEAREQDRLHKVGRGWQRLIDKAEEEERSKK